MPLVEPATAADFETRGARRYDEARYDQAIADYSAALQTRTEAGLRDDESRLGVLS